MPYFTDDFNRANSSTVGNGWVEEGADDWSILSNHLTVDNTGGGFVRQDDVLPDSADYAVEAVFNITFDPAHEGTWPSVLARWASTTSFYLCQLGVGADHLKRLQIYKNVGGWTVLSSIAVTITDQQDYTVKFTLKGSALKSYQDGVLKGSVSDGDITAKGKFAIRSGSIVGTTTWDDYKVYGDIKKIEATLWGGVKKLAGIVEANIKKVSSILANEF